MDAMRILPLVGEVIVSKPRADAQIELGTAVPITWKPEGRQNCRRDSQSVPDDRPQRVCLRCEL